jgi:hypothetical protein
MSAAITRDIRPANRSLRPHLVSVNSLSDPDVTFVA